MRRRQGGGLMVCVSPMLAPPAVQKQVQFVFVLCMVGGVGTAGPDTAAWLAFPSCWPPPLPVPEHASKADQAHALQQRTRGQQHVRPLCNRTVQRRLYIGGCVAGDAQVSHLLGGRWEPAAEQHRVYIACKRMHRAFVGH